MRLCVNCKHYRCIMRDSVCTHKKMEELDGNVVLGYRKIPSNCFINRKGECGAEGKYFEEKAIKIKDRLYKLLTGE